MAKSRTEKQVIDAAIRENQWNENLCYGLVLLFALTGIFAIIAGVVLNQGLISISGSIASALIWPALRIAVQIRKENIAIRFLEIPLSKASNAEEAA